MSDVSRALARWRVPLGFACAVVVFWLAEPTRATLEHGTLIAAAGEALRFWAAGHLNKSREVIHPKPMYCERQVGDTSGTAPAP